MIPNGTQQTAPWQQGTGMTYNPTVQMGTGTGQYMAGSIQPISPQPTMIMATPVTTNNGQQIQNPQQNVPTQSSYQQTYIPGRFANSPDEIGVIEVPMNSPMAVFPKPDRSEIYVKYWTEQGVQTETFVRKDPEQPNINVSESDILQALSNVMERLSKLESSQQTKSTTKKTNKEDLA